MAEGGGFWSVSILHFDFRLGREALTADPRRAKRMPMQFVAHRRVEDSGRSVETTRSAVGRSNEAHRTFSGDDGDVKVFIAERRIADSAETRVELLEVAALFRKERPGVAYEQHHPAGVAQQDLIHEVIGKGTGVDKTLCANDIHLQSEHLGHRVAGLPVADQVRAVDRGDAVAPERVSEGGCACSTLRVQRRIKPFVPFRMTDENERGRGSGSRLYGNCRQGTTTGKRQHAREKRPPRAAGHLLLKTRHTGFSRQEFALDIPVRSEKHPGLPLLLTARLHRQFTRFRTRSPAHPVNPIECRRAHGRPCMNAQ